MCKDTSHETAERTVFNKIHCIEIMPFKMFSSFNVKAHVQLIILEKYLKSLNFTNIKCKENQFP